VGLMRWCWSTAGVDCGQARFAVDVIAVLLARRAVRSCFRIRCSSRIRRVSDSDAGQVLAVQAFGELGQSVGRRAVELQPAFADHVGDRGQRDVVFEFPEQPLHEICVGKGVILAVQAVFTVIFR
jgi:hypothetical protein